MLYGGRPGALGVLRLFRQVMSHLAVTGGVALTDSVVQQVIGHGVAARLSARLGEGMVNGLLTARLGLLTIDLVRPLPFHELPRPALNDLAGTLLRPAGNTGRGSGTAENRIIGPKSDCFLRPWGPAAICRPSHTRTWPYRPSGGSGLGFLPLAEAHTSAAEQPEKTMALPDYSMRQLLEAGVHFGHQAHRWNPKMGNYIFGTRNNIHIIDLAQSVPMLHQALEAVSDAVAKGGRILFVGTKRQAQDGIAEAAKSARSITSTRAGSAAR